MGDAFCIKCPQKEKCQEICKELEHYLNRLQSKEGYSDRHRRRKERVWDSRLIENLAAKRAFKIKGLAGRHKPHIYSDNWENGVNEDRF